MQKTFLCTHYFYGKITSYEEEGVLNLKIFAERLRAMKWKLFLYLDVSPLRFHQFNDHFPQLFRISQLPGIIKLFIYLLIY